jgi:hypothetical protein
LAPDESQRCHAYTNEIGVAPPQEPLDDVSVCPSRAVPLIAGGDALTGGEAFDPASANDVSRRAVITAALKDHTLIARLLTIETVSADGVSLLHPE